MYNYVAKLEGGNFYIGHTGNLERLNDNKICSGWVKLHPVEDINEIHVIKDDNVSTRTILTLIYMKHHGINKVRGGIYSQTILNDTNLREINRYLERFKLTSSYEDVKNVYIDVNNTKKKIWMCSQRNRLDYFQLLDKFDELEYIHEFLSHSTDQNFTRSKKYSFAEHVDFYNPRELINVRKRRRY